MKKIAKLSLVAATAVACMSTASAKDLTEAIKNVDVSGSIVYRYDDSSDAANNSKVTNTYKAVLNLKSKVNDNVTANTSFAVNNNTDTALNTQTGGDQNLDVELTKVNFSYTGLANTTVIVGKQGLATPWTVASSAAFNEQTGTGILALSNFGPLTIAGAYFNQTNLNAIPGGDIDGDASGVFDGSENIATIGLIGNVGPVALDAWYLSLMDSDEGAATDASFDTYTLGAKYNTELSGIKLGLDARYTNLEFDEEAVGTTAGGLSADNALAKIKLTAKMGMFNGKVAYGKTDKDGGVVALDKHAKTAMTGWTTKLNGQRDSEYLQLSLGAQVLPKLNVSINYNDLDSDADNTKDHEELYAQFVYKMSKNFTTLVRLGQSEKGHNSNNDKDMGRFQLVYKY